MGKVSIGLRGWRFDEEAVLEDDGSLRPFDELDEDDRRRLLRLQQLVEAPCDACWLIHGDADVDRCNVARAVYGEPLAEVVVCDEHEADLVYWFREAGGREHAGMEDFEDAFHEWFAAGNRAPEDYAGIEHVETAPETVPDGRVEACEFPDPDDEESSDEAVEHDLDLSREYPSS